MSNITDLDQKILRLLQKDARLSNVAIAEQLHVSHSTVARRIEDLRAQGYIKGFAAVLDRAKLGLGEIVLVMVQLKAHGDGVTDEFEQEINKNYPNVIESFKLSGSWDYVLKVAVRGMAHYDEIHTNLVRHPTVKLMRSYPVFAVVEAPLPID